MNKDDVRDSVNQTKSFVFLNPNKDGKSPYYKGFLIMLPLFLFLSLYIFMLAIGNSGSENSYVLFAFRVCFLSATYLAINGYFNTVHEVRIDDESISVRKFISFKIVKWEHIKYVRAYSFSTNGLTFVWIKKKSDAPELSTRFFIIWVMPREKQRTNMLFKMLKAVKKNTVLKYNREIQLLP